VVGLHLLSGAVQQNLEFFPFIAKLDYCFHQAVSALEGFDRLHIGV